MMGVMEPFPLRFADVDVCDLTTTGRRSGKPHTVEIWFTVSGTTLYLIAGLGERCDWLRNIDADPRASVVIAGEHWRGQARRVTDPAERRRVGEIVDAKYPDYEGESDIGLTRPIWLFDVPAVAIESWQAH